MRCKLCLLSQTTDFEREKGCKNMISPELLTIKVKVQDWGAFLI